MADHSDKLCLWVLSELVGKGQGYQRSQRVQDRAIPRLSGGPEVPVTPVRSYSKIALFITTSNQIKDMSGGPSRFANCHNVVYVRQTHVRLAVFCPVSVRLAGSFAPFYIGNKLSGSDLIPHTRSRLRIHHLALQPNRTGASGGPAENA